MLPRLLPGHTYSTELAGRLTKHANAADTAANGLVDSDCVERLVGFCEDAAWELSALHPAALDHLLFSPTHWAIRTVSSQRTLRVTVQRELRSAKTRLEAAAEAVRNEALMWRLSGQVVVPDTNVFLHVTGGRIAGFDWRTPAQISPAVSVTIAVVAQVIDELDRHKRSNGDVKRAARRALRELDQRLQLGFGPLHLGGEVSLAVVPDPPAHVRLPSADAEIVDRALDLQSRVTQVTFLTGDTGAAIRARAQGLDVKHVPTPDPDKLMDSEDVAQALGTNTKSFDAMRSAPEVPRSIDGLPDPIVVIHDKPYWDRAAVETWLQSRTQRTGRA